MREVNVSSKAITCMEEKVCILQRAFRVGIASTQFSAAGNNGADSGYNIFGGVRRVENVLHLTAEPYGVYFMRG